MTRLVRAMGRAALVMLAAISASAGRAEPVRETFAIYESAGKRLPGSDANALWEAFYRHGALTRRLITDEDIEAYDWDNQAIILTEAASRNFKNGPRYFIVTLGDRRLYGGLGMPEVSSMGVWYPVIYIHRVENRIALVIRPWHDFMSASRQKDPLWRQIAPPELEEHFKRLGKLRRPWSEEPYVRLAGSLHRIGALRVSKTETTLAVAYDLEGARHGAYRIEEELSLKSQGPWHLGGPRYRNNVEIADARMHREITFPGRDPTYRSELEAVPPRGDRSKLVWHIVVSVEPVLSERERDSLDPVARVSWALQLYFNRETDAQGEKRHPMVADRKTVEIPVD